MADGRTLQSGDSAWGKNLYRHPHRQGLHPQDIYVMQHDISHGLVVSGANFYDAPTDLRLPDLGRN